MLIFPIGHESNTVRRLPWITFIIIAICLIVHIFVSLSMKNVEKRLESAAVEFVEYFLSHPYLEFDPDLKDMIFGELYNEQFDAILETYRMQYPPPTFTFERDEEQEKLNELAQRFKAALKDVPYRKYGFIPARKTITGLFTYMFIHGGWLHLLGNLFFLYLTGPFIEDVWGRPLYAVFYVTVGVVSALMFAVHYPKLAGPLIGASGAIAGVMGAFLIRYWNTRIEFFYLFFLFVRGTFKAPAWLMLPLWAVLELFNARMVDSISPETGGGVAHWAHVWGFVIGAGIALAIKFNRVEERHIAPKIQKQISYVSDSYQALEEAAVLKRQGDFNQAFSLLLAAVEKDPTNDDVVEGLWNLGAEVERVDETSQYILKMIEREIRRNQLEQALHHYRRLKERVSKVSLSLPYKIKILEVMSKEKSPVEANSLAKEILEKINANSPAMLVLNFTRISFNLDPQLAKKAAELCLQHPEITDSQKEEIKEKYAELKTKVRFEFDEVSGQYSHFQTKMKTPEKSEVDEDVDEDRQPEEDAAFDVLQTEVDSDTLSPEDASSEPLQPKKDKKKNRLSAYLNFDDNARFDEIQPDTSGYGESEDQPAQVEEESSQTSVKSEEPFEAENQETITETTPDPGSSDKEASSEEGPTPHFPGVENTFGSFPGMGKKENGSQIPLDAEEQKPDFSAKQTDDKIQFPGEKPKEMEKPSDSVSLEEKISAPIESAPSKTAVQPTEIKSEPKTVPEPPEKVKHKEDDTYFAPVRSKSLKLIKANIKGIKGDKISIDALKIGPRLLPLSKVKTIAVAEITSPYEPSYYLIDLFLDDLKSYSETIRSIRLFSSAFDPVKFFPDIPDSKKALKAFISFLLETSKATPIPDESSVLLEKPHKYFFIEDYEDFILS